MKQHESFSTVFTLLNGMYPRKIVDVEGDFIVPVDKRTALMFQRLLSQEVERYVFFHEPEEIYRDVAESRRAKVRRESKQAIGADLAFYQTEIRTVFTNSSLPLTEELVELLTMLYFRAQGYMVQKPLRTYNGTDDVIVWKSPLVEKLRSHKLIEYGCFVDELGQLRTLGKVVQTRQEKASNELILIEAKSSIRMAIKNNGGVNQLIGTGWSESKPTKYKQGANQCNMATKLFITFPAHFPSSFPEARSFEDIDRLLDQRQPDTSKIGVLCWEPTTFHFKDSAEFPHENMNEELNKYERYAMQQLLKNFYFDELLSLMQEMHIEFTGKTANEVFSELNSVVQENDAVMLSALDAILT